MPPVASLLLAHRPERRIMLVIGDGRLAQTRVRTAKEAGLETKLAWNAPVANISSDMHQVSTMALFPSKDDKENCIRAWEHILNEIDGPDASLFAVCVTDTLVAVPNDASSRRLRCEILAKACRTRRLPLNVTDTPELCTFSFPASHRFATDDEENASSLQLAVTTNGRGCRLAGRIRRHLVASLPASVGLAVERIGEMRELAKARTSCRGDAGELEDEPALNDALGYSSTAENESDACTVQRRRMRWVAQISEFWPLERLASLDQTQMQALLENEMDASSRAQETSAVSEHIEPVAKRSRHDLDLSKPRRKGHVYLLGSGPGHPALLTVAARDILTSPDTDVILSDKLVPTAVLALIPSTTPLVIAKKFPGNAEGAQSELISQALKAANEGKTVVRLKQGDPFVYGRGGEELVACQNAGIECTVVPGISSAIGGPLMVNIPVTQRGAAESMIMSTGVGRGGKRVMLPGYERSRTLLLLMGVARLPAVIETLTSRESPGRHGDAYPPYTPIAIVERASSEDQRLIASTLDRIVHVMDTHITDGQRPPGMLVVGWAVLSLTSTQVAGAHVLDDEAECYAEHEHDPLRAAKQLAERDAARIDRWLGSRGFYIREGLPHGYDRFAQDAPALTRSLDDPTMLPRSSSGWAAPRYGEAMETPTLAPSSQPSS